MYDEVDYYDKSWLSEYWDITGKKEIGHFTQMVWAKTWKIGCGFTAYLDGDSYNWLYVCNYGPAYVFLINSVNANKMSKLLIVQKKNFYVSKD
ncbi:UNVERIFIED_CONTAM: CRISP/Allergen/PR-1 [Trichonephila clavipes]